MPERLAGRQPAHRVVADVDAAIDRVAEALVGAPGDAWLASRIVARLHGTPVGRPRGRGRLVLAATFGAALTLVAIWGSGWADRAHPAPRHAAVAAGPPVSTSEEQPRDLPRATLAAAPIASGSAARRRGRARGVAPAAVDGGAPQPGSADALGVDAGPMPLPVDMLLLQPIEAPAIDHR
jgi:hypothetical protein